VLVGRAGAGKSCVTIRFIAGRFLDYYEPTVEDLYRKTIELGDDNEPYVVDIFDTAGQDEFRVVRDAYLRDADGVVGVYAINDKESFREISRYYDHVRRCKSESVETPIPFVLLGNKCDIKTSEREVSYKEGEELAKYLNAIQFYETSALNGQNIHDAFFELFKGIKRQLETDELGSLEQKAEKKTLQKKKRQEGTKCILI